jgi:hypothetical protein
VRPRPSSARTPRSWWPSRSRRNQDAHFSKQKIVESIPGTRVVWHILAGYLKFTEDKTEWTGTDVAFDISRKDDKTEIRFTHIGLVPDFVTRVRTADGSRIDIPGKSLCIFRRDGQGVWRADVDIFNAVSDRRAMAVPAGSRGPASFTSRPNATQWRGKTLMVGSAGRRASSCAGHRWHNDHGVPLVVEQSLRYRVAAEQVVQHPTSRSADNDERSVDSGR